MFNGANKYYGLLFFSAFVLDSASPHALTSESCAVVKDINELFRCWEPKLSLKSVAYQVNQFPLTLLFITI